MKKTTANNVGYSLIRPFLKLFVFVCMNPKTIHKERIPKKGGFVYAGTHTSYYDSLVVGNSTIRPLHFLAKKELMDKKVLGKILRAIGVVRVDRSTHNPEAKKEAINVLKDGSVVCVFPESTINKTDGPIIPFKYGAVSMAHKAGVPVIPFAITKNPKAKIFNYKTKMIIGKPFYVKTDDYEKETKKLEKIVIELVKEGIEYDKKNN